MSGVAGEGAGPGGGTRIEPLLFGNRMAPLFGCFQAGASPEHDLGLVICPGLGHEYVQFHRALRQLATLLSDAGFPSLRFDFTGCGDSAGAENNWSLERWRADVASACEELRERAEIQHVGLVGLRLGGGLALQADVDADLLVMWDPVFDGTHYVAELREQHARMLRYAHVIPEAGGAMNEVLGSALTPEFERELESLDVLQLDRLAAPRVLLVESHEAVEQQPLADHLVQLGATLQHERLPNAQLWEWVEDFGRVHVPRRALTTIVTWVEAMAGELAPELPAW